MLTASFWISSILFGTGLAMDAFSVSVAAGLHDPSLQKKRTLCIAGTFGLFQMAMPLIGWLFVRTAAEKFLLFQRAVPWIAVVLLCAIGGKMILEDIVKSDASAQDAAMDAKSDTSLRGAELIAQGVATSIDALSVGFTIASLGWQEALAEALVIGAVTFVLCLGGLRLGRVFGNKLAGKAGIAGGLILIAIGLRILFKSILA